MLFTVHYKCGSHTATIGGLLIALPKEQAKGFCQELEVSRRILVLSLLYIMSHLCHEQERDASPAWIIGDVTTGM